MYMASLTLRNAMFHPMGLRVRKWGLRTIGGTLLAALSVCASAAKAVPPTNPAPTLDIPLCPGLTVVTAVNQSDGDYESIKRVMNIDAKAITIAYGSERTVIDDLTNVAGLQTTRVSHDVRVADQAGADMYLIEWMNDLPKVVPGTTSLGPSHSVLTALKTKGSADLTLVRYLLPGATLDPSKREYIFNGKTVFHLVRDPKPASVSILVNGKPSLLSAVRATADTLGEKVEFFFLDDPRNPIALKFRLGIGARTEINQQMRAAVGKPTYPSDDHDQLQVVRISFSCTPQPLPTVAGVPQAGGIPPDGKPAVVTAAEGGTGVADAPGSLVASLEASLNTKGGSVDVYDIFFSFGSAKIRAESSPTLSAITAVMKAHPDWNLQVAGHTDSIAADAYNLALSSNRSAAVKAELVARGVLASRLTTQGFGETRPRDTNDTLLGRARNRRVELTRQ